MEDKKMLKEEELEKVNGGAGLEMKELIGSPLAAAADPAQVSGGAGLEMKELIGSPLAATADPVQALRDAGLEVKELIGSPLPAAADRPIDLYENVINKFRG